VNFKFNELQRQYGHVNFVQECIYADCSICMFRWQLGSDIVADCKNIFIMLFNITVKQIRVQFLYFRLLSVKGIKDQLQ
jgi:hypothetical protein